MRNGGGNMGPTRQWRRPVHFIPIRTAQQSRGSSLADGRPFKYPA
ncbi:hypothetical protein OKW27_007700 [Paraburkholderia sp. 35.1]